MDISLGDILYIGGGLFILAAVSICFTYRAEIAQAIMSIRPTRGGFALDDDGSRSGFGDPVLAGSFQAQSEPAAKKSWAELGATLQNDEELIDFLSTIKTSEGDYRFSANRVRDIVGGADAIVKGRVASHRPKPARPQTRRLERPANGWGKAS